ncbi:hypothetical protein NPIL_613251 [Nephila pilipes]|uniref:Uncharacterized protein n=1 Tax=Nephila pilipes TaxID=299642 RepID=A0A8X6QZ95_NEPPI|nr:hypothetical protein NPIL_613251 [Nephila pilipes]
MTDQRDHRYRVMDSVSQVLRNADIQIANQHQIRTQQIFATSVWIHALQFPNKVRDIVNFQKTRLSMSFDDGQTSELGVITTNIVIRLEGRVIRTPLIALPDAKENRAHLRMDFLQNAGIVPNLKRRNWFFSDSSPPNL